MAETKRCSTCGMDVPLTEFNKRTSAPDGLQWRCRACSRRWYEMHRAEHTRNTRARSKELRLGLALRIAEYLADHPCIDCGESDIRCLDFDHRDRTTKFAAVSAMIARQFSWVSITSEIAKCDVRCANCHRKRTAEQLNTIRQRFVLGRAPSSLAGPTTSGRS